MDFNSLYQSNLHCVPVGPFENPTYQLIGSDIVAHLCTLEWFASQCDHVTEFGVRTGQSTSALIAGCKGKVLSFDIERTPIVDVFNNMTLPCSWEFIQGDTGGPLPFKETDLLFVDSLHVKFHVERELFHHGRKAKKYLVFHDTFTCLERDLSGPDPNAVGIGPAIDEFLAQYPGEYKTVYRTNRNNGLWVLERINQ